MYNGPFDFFPGGFTHDFLYLPNGHLIVLSHLTRISPIFRDIRVSLWFKETLSSTWIRTESRMDLEQLRLSRYGSSPNGLPDWTHSNALIYSASDGNLLLSMRHQSWILKIDYNNGAGSGNVLWRLGYQGDFALTQNGRPQRRSKPVVLISTFPFDYYPERRANHTGDLG